MTTATPGPGETPAATRAAAPARGPQLTPAQTKNLQQIIFKTLINARARAIEAGAPGAEHGHRTSLKRRALFTAVRDRCRDLFNPGTINDRTARRLFADMIQAGYPVGSHSAYGYFLLITTRDMRLAKIQALRRLRAARNAAAKLEKNFYNQTQRKLFYIPNSPRTINHAAPAAL